MAKFVYYIPYAYFFASRVTTASARVSWVLIYFVPLCLTLWVFSNDFGLHQILDLVIAATLIYSIYELGYLENDVVTVQGEESPTLRVNQEETGYIKSHFVAIILSRVSLGAVGLWWLENAPGLVWLFIQLSLLIAVFLLYNRVRGSINAMLHPILVTVRYCAPVVVLIPDLKVVAFITLLFPLINSLERAAEPRYGLKWLQKLWLTNQVSGRWSYYLILAGLLGAYVGLAGQSVMLMLPVVYMLLYRLVTALLRPRKVAA